MLFVSFRLTRLCDDPFNAWKQFKLAFSLSCALTWLVVVGDFIFGIFTEHQRNTTRISIV